MAQQFATARIIVECPEGETKVTSLRNALKYLQALTNLDENAPIKIQVTGIQELTAAEAHEALEADSGA
jgi:hypothetical protein